MIDKTSHSLIPRGKNIPFPQITTIIIVVISISIGIAITQTTKPFYLIVLLRYKSNRKYRICLAPYCMFILDGLL